MAHGRIRNKKTFSSGAKRNGGVSQRLQRKKMPQETNTLMGMGAPQKKWDGQVRGKGQKICERKKTKRRHRGGSGRSAVRVRSHSTTPKKGGS